MYQKVLQEIFDEIKALPNPGRLPDYIPELANIPPDKFAIHISTLDDKNYGIGDTQEKFSLQSITKVFGFMLAYSILGKKIFERVGVEPSGDPFNSLVLLEQEKGIPRNPLINSGALVVCDILIDELENPAQDLFDYIRHISGNATIKFNRRVYISEKKSGFRNQALVNLMKSFDTIHNEAEDVLNLYYKLCATEMTVEELSKTFLLFADEGKLHDTEERILTKSQVKRINAIMQTCGFYDEAGEFSFRVGLPGKSGVGGGIVAVHPGEYAVAVWSPKLNEKGNSLMGMKALELLTTKLGLSIF